MTNSDEINFEPEIDKLQELKENTETVELTTKKKRGRKPKSEIISEPELPEIDLTPVLNIIINRLPNPKELTQTESILFNSTANKVFQKYGGNFKYIEEVNLSLVLLSIVYPRLKKENNENKENEVS